MAPNADNITFASLNSTSDCHQALRSWMNVDYQAYRNQPLPSWANATLVLQSASTQQYPCITKAQLSAITEYLTASTTSDDASSKLDVSDFWRNLAKAAGSCQISTCRELGFKGNPDIAGIGVWTLLTIEVCFSHRQSGSHFIWRDNRSHADQLHLCTDQAQWHFCKF